jgi:type IV fimbrial biogenesis protein FimT
MKLQRHRFVQSGFTAFELIIVMAIVGILAAVGTSSFKYVTASNRIATEINALLGDMRYARTEAIREGLPVTVCASADQATCSKSSTSWQSGWLIFSDPSGTQTVGTNPILRVQPSLSTSFNNSTDVFVVTNGIYAVTFNRQGFGASIPVVTTTTVMALHTQPANATWTRCLAITVAGQLTIQQTTTSVTCT